MQLTCRGLAAMVLLIIWILFPLFAEWKVSEIGYESVTVRDIYASEEYYFAFLENYEGLYRRHKDSSQWEFILDIHYLEEMAFSNNIVMTNRGWISHDYGKSWEETTDTLISGVSISTNGRIITTNNADAIIYTDDGKRWHYSNFNESRVQQFSKIGEDLFAGLWGGIYISKDNGESWSVFGEGLPERTWVKKIVLFDDSIYVVSTENGFYRRTKMDSLWTSLNLTDSTFISEHPEKVIELVQVGDKVYALYNTPYIKEWDEVYQISLYEDSLHAEPLHFDSYHLRKDIACFGSTLAVASYNGVHLLLKDGTWKTDGEGIQKKSRFESIHIWGDYILSMSDESGQRYLFRTEDNGESWDSIFAVKGGGYSVYTSGDTLRLMESPFENHPVYLSKDGGDSWIETVYVPDTNSDIDTTLERPRNIIWDGGERQIGYTRVITNNGKSADYVTYVSEDSGKSFSIADEPLNGVWRICDNSNGELIGWERTGYVYSADSGKQWRKIVPEGSRPVTLYGFHSGIIFAEIYNLNGYEWIIGYSLDKGKTWQPLLDPDWQMFNPHECDQVYKYGNVYVLRDGLVYARSLSEIGGTALVNSSQLFKQKNLLTFTQAGKLRGGFSLSSEGRYSIKLYTALGKQVGGITGAGVVGLNHFEFDTHSLGDAVYLLQLESEEQKYSKQLLIK